MSVYEPRWVKKKEVPAEKMAAQTPSDAPHGCCGTCRYLDLLRAREEGWPAGLGVCVLGWAAHGEGHIGHAGVPRPVMSIRATCMTLPVPRWQLRPEREVGT